MRAAMVVLGFSASLLAAGALADKVVEVRGEGRAAPATLPLVWIDVYGVARGARPAALAEASALLAPVGVHIDWEVSDTGQRTVRDGEVQVVILPSPPPSLGPHIMGAAQPSPEGIRVVWVFASPVRAALGLHPRATEALRPQDTRRLGRALARVMLHEIVHVARPGRPHSHRGLMAPRLSRSMLEGAVTLEPGLVDVFRMASMGREAPALGGAAAIAALGPMVVD